MKLQRRAAAAAVVEVSEEESVSQSVIQYSGNQLAKLQDNRGNKHTHVIIPKWLIALVIYLTLDDFAKSLSQPLHFGSISVFTRSFAFQCSV